jgi:hypothetical protein
MGSPMVAQLPERAFDSSPAVGHAIHPTPKDVGFLTHFL